MMEVFDVVIVGGGPAGLICAQRLSHSGMSILLIEKDEVFGDKVCAGGLTRKGLKILDLPEEIIQQKVCRTVLHSPGRYSHANSPDPIVVTVDRRDLGRWQASCISTADVKILKNTKVKEVRASRVVLEDDREIAYGSLVGADGYSSVVRRYLGLPQEKKLIGIQYLIPDGGIDPAIEIFLDHRHFHSWYAWIFPHKDHLAVGCVCDPGYFSPKKMKKAFQDWLHSKNLDISGAEYQSAPISYDYRGLKFDNIYLAGDAAGIASGLTGEGIYQSLVSGIQVACYISGEQEELKEFKFVLRYNRIQERIMKFLIRIGPFRVLIYEIIILLMNNKRFKNKVNKGFS
jgi:geranylgeranyl reductase